MKRSKVFLGLTTGLLAVAGVVAAKSAKFHQTSYRIHSLPGNQGACVAVTPQVPATISTGTPLVTTIGTVGNNVYYTAVTANCTTPLFVGI